ncbi:hypothetical protein C7M56_17165 [Clostridium botulinum]|uniref:Alkylmercury lyase n=2 Tax=Clostridium botulinum TaxID=1491 RepID=A0ABC8CX82_CLOBO|nr:hypothetical protein C7M56_17165 [Clostridium botulinum]
MLTLEKNNLLDKEIDLNVIKHYEEERLIINSIDSKLSYLEKKVRIYIMDYIIEEKRPYNLKTLDYNFICNIGVTKDEFINIVLSLKNKKVLVMDEKENINFIYPVSAFDTNYKVKLEDSREINAMCAVDSIGTAFTFKQNIKIESSCIMCNDSIEVIIENGEIKKCIPENLRVLHVDLNKNDSWASSC